MHIGVVLPQTGADFDEVLDSARHAEEAGADSVWVVDHLLGIPQERGILESWTLLSALATATERVELGAQVFCQSFRNPGLLAKMAATLDRVSQGRLRMLIGAGWFEAEYRAFGYEFPPPGVLLGQLRDSVRILKGMLSGSSEPFVYKGAHYSVHDVVNLPPPVRAPMPIEVGVLRERAIRFVGAEADGWNCPALALDGLEGRLKLLDEACTEAGRSIDDLRLTCQIVCAIDDPKFSEDPRLSLFKPEFGLVGSVDEVAARMRELADQGMEGFHVLVARGDRGKRSLERLISEVKPKVTG